MAQRIPGVINIKYWQALHCKLTQEYQEKKEMTRIVHWRGNYWKNKEW